MNNVRETKEMVSEKPVIDPERRSVVWTEDEVVELAPTKPGLDTASASTDHPIAM